MTCPTCGKPVERQDNPYRPFCSERCKLLDLSHWVNEEYLIPGPPVPEKESENEELNEESRPPQ